FHGPHDIAAFNDEYVYVADTYNHRIQVFDANGNFIRKWGSNGTADGQFIRPHGIKIDSNGLIYVTDYWNHRIQVFDANGNFITKWGSEGLEDGQFSYPPRIEVDSSGYKYVTDTYNHRIQVFDTDNTFIGKWGSEGSSDGQFSSPWGIALNSQGLIYIVDRSNDRVQVFRSSISFIPPSKLFIPGVPQKLQYLVSNGKVTLSWQAPSYDGGTPIVEYRIYRSLTSGEPYSFLGSTIGLQFTDFTHDNNKEYYYVVTAVNTIGESVYSIEVMVTIEALSEPTSIVEPRQFIPFLKLETCFIALILITLLIHKRKST
ncbi:MAG: 6-bladed beta-propeller, partial [Candidatus Hodarchaeota archaeon]